MSSDKKAILEGPNKLKGAFEKELSLASLSVHADDYINNHQAVAPPMHVSTTFRYSDDPDKLVAWENLNPNAPYDSHVYSRDSAPNTTRFEAVLSSVIGAPCVTYASGLAAFHAMIVFLNPRRVAIGDGYHGCHGVLKIMSKLNGLEQLELEDEADLAKLRPGDVIHVETPLNPTGEARDLERYRRIADEKGCYLTVDATFAPPPLMDPFRFGVDVVMHSATKYFGGHSDMLSGVLAVRPDRAWGEGEGEGGKPAEGGWIHELKEERLHLGGVMGNMEGWLGVRSLRTLELRVRRQSESAQALVDFFAAEKSKGGDGLVADLVFKIQHASQQAEARDANSWLRRQMPNGFGPVFSIWLKTEEHARRLPSKLHLFHHATSLGGVESLIEWRAMTDPKIDRRLLRVSIGVEGWEDLRDDLLQGLQALKEELGN
ncbi:pyridoxal phosphate-dependent transferase [Cladorrhinum samala]|uniref:Pyridoxal phosphate-dependent transferase n=1 Tax=Cladorrhinum samala TaxID=585594 RepID=A0AAV9HH14_9PEZI|nr:pyridoxal phosphate-dependent transferase [Cladorrhinum samala]